MSASAERRRRATTIGALAALLSFVLLVALGFVGASTLAGSQAGRDATADRALPQIILPETPAALMAIVDEDGALTGVVAAVLAPDGVGGSIVVIPPTASTSPTDEDVFPLAETWSELGAEEFVLDVEGLTGVSFDLIEAVTIERLSALLGAIDTVEVIVPSESAEAVDAAPESLRILGPDQIAMALTDRPITGPDADLDPYRTAVWAAVAATLGTEADSTAPSTAPSTSSTAATADAVGSPTTVAPVPPADLDDFLGRLFAGPVGVRGLTSRAPTPLENPRGVEAVILDRPELVLVFAQIAPGRIATPSASYNFRIVSNFTPEQLADAGVNGADLVREVVQVLLFVQANVVSVDSAPIGAPAETTASVSAPELLDSFDRGWTLIFGDIEVGEAEVEVGRVDATVVLGEDYLDHRRRRVEESG